MQTLLGPPRLTHVAAGDGSGRGNERGRLVCLGRGGGGGYVFLREKVCQKRVCVGGETVVLVPKLVKCCIQ